MDAIRTQGLTKKFRRVMAVNGVTLTVPEGCIYALVGTNGAGKTTLIKTLMNILEPTSGRAEVLGWNSRRLSGQAFTKIGYVSENQELPEWMTVEYFLRYCKGFYPAWDDALAADMVRQFGLPLDRKLRHLSRGMRMKAALASSLAYRPKLIVLDEPFSGLDALVRDELIETLLEHAAEATVLISSHDLSEIESFASHIGYLDNGHLHFSEEMTTLSSRFREIEITLASAEPLPRPWPKDWLEAQSSAAVVRFVESQFDPERTPERIKQAFPSARDVAIRSIPLRQIFVTLAKTHRASVAA